MQDKKPDDQQHSDEGVNNRDDREVSFKSIMREPGQRKPPEFQNPEEALVRELLVANDPEYWRKINDLTKDRYATGEIGFGGRYVRKHERTSASGASPSLARHLLSWLTLLLPILILGSIVVLLFLNS